MIRKYVVLVVENDEKLKESVSLTTLKLFTTCDRQQHFISDNPLIKTRFQIIQLIKFKPHC